VRLRNPGTADAAISAIGTLGFHLGNSRSGLGAADKQRDFLRWVEDVARPQFESWLADAAEVVGELDSAYNRVVFASGVSEATLLGLLNREFDSMGRLLDRVSAGMRALKALADRPGVPVVLDTSVLMESRPLFHEFDWRRLDSALASGVRLVVPILVVGELDDLRHDKKAERREKARIATRKLIELHKGTPTMPAPLPARPGVTIEVLLDEGWHQRLPNNDAEIIEQALRLRGVTGDPVFLASCDVTQMYLTGAVSLPWLEVPRSTPGPPPPHS
jgi:rRNA-processing protein FCF1